MPLTISHCLYQSAEFPRPAHPSLIQIRPVRGDFLVADVGEHGRRSNRATHQLLLGNVFHRAPKEPLTRTPRLNEPRASMQAERTVSPERYHSPSDPRPQMSLLSTWFSTPAAHLFLPSIWASTSP